MKLYEILSRNIKESGFVLADEAIKNGYIGELLEGDDDRFGTCAGCGEECSLEADGYCPQCS